MSLSKYTSTPETTNTARLARLILGPCTDVLREILKKEIPPSDLSKEVKQWIDDLKKNKKRNPLNPSQNDIVFPSPTNQYGGDYSDLDISILYTILRNVGKIPQHSKGWGENPDPADRSVAANIERVRFLRNKYYGHSADISLSDSEFKQEWRNIRDIVVELERDLGSSTFYQDSVTDIKICSMDPETEQKYIEKLDKVDELYSTISNFSDSMKNIKENLTKLRDPKLEKEIDSSRIMIERHEQDMTNTFVEIRALERAKQLLEENSYVIIKGNPGSGKTTLAKWLLKILMDNGKRPLQLFKVSKLYGRVTADDNIAVFIDNLFGEFSFSSTEFNEFINKKELIESVLKSCENRSGNVLLLTIRNDIYMEVVEKQKSNPFFCTSVTDLSSGEYALQTNEIEMFLKKYGLTAEGKDEDMKEKPSELYRTLGFPQCCSLARENPEFGKNILTFFNDPHLYLKDYIDTQIKEKHAKTAVLIYILLKGGQVEAAILENPKDREAKIVALGMLDLGRSSFGQFQKSIYSYKGFLTKHDKINNAFVFSHSSVQEALFKEMFVAFPEDITRNCHHSLLRSLTTNINPKSTQNVVEKEMFEIVASRIEQILKKGSDSGFRSVSVLELWNDSDFYNHVLKNELCIEYIIKQVDSKGNGMIVHFAKAGNIDWVRKLLQISDESQKYRSLNAASAENQQSAVRIILSSRVKSDLTTCFHAIHGGNVDLFMELCESVDALQTSFSLHPNCSNTNNSLLHEVCSMGQLRFVEPLLSRYPKLKDIKKQFR
ncbi:uncharacterized protein LOC134254142 [Saccostrea cucullata]|uniref:uncharacterized protein LOC134254142 n=1 Tax=Saccostrea cuccullata TaxID=36930 RepID=UPI002ED2CE13